MSEFVIAFSVGLDQIISMKQRRSAIAGRDAMKCTRACGWTMAFPLVKIDRQPIGRSVTVFPISPVTRGDPRKACSAFCGGLGWRNSIQNLDRDLDAFDIHPPFGLRFQFPRKGQNDLGGGAGVF
ncbi:hypothetical protein [Stieleria sp.]|uniref:hypothetical protein n=1 Tax=Stieleria sp. TaxID=2795976 RepID=UPI00356A37DA